MAFEKEKRQKASAKPENIKDRFDRELASLNEQERALFDALRAPDLAYTAKTHELNVWLRNQEGPVLESVFSADGDFEEHINNAIRHYFGGLTAASGEHRAAADVAMKQFESSLRFGPSIQGIKNFFRYLKIARLYDLWSSTNIEEIRETANALGERLGLDLEGRKPN